MNTHARHVIFGTGAIALATLDALGRRGETVRLVNRSGSAPVPDDVEVVGGDAADPQSTTAVTRGARVVYQALNPPYSRWLQEFPALQAGVLAAAQAAGARLVSMDNVYLYGRPAGQPLTETRTHAAWHLPNDSDTRTTRQLVDAVHRQADQPRTRLRRVHPRLLRVAALTNPTVRELLEMQYQFDEPFIVDSSRIAAHLGVRATPLGQAVADTLAAYRSDAPATARRA